MDENQKIKYLEEQFDIRQFSTNEFWYYPILKNLVYFDLTYTKLSKQKQSNLKIISNAFVKALFNSKSKNADILTISSSSYLRKNEKTKQANTFFYFISKIFSNFKIINYINIDTNINIQNIAMDKLFFPDFSFYFSYFKSKFTAKRKIIYDKKLVTKYLELSESNITVAQIEEKLHKFHIYVDLYTKLLKRTKPKVVLMLWHYNFWNFALSYACNGLNIPIIEFQHGIISKHHLAYMYKTVVERKLFPNYIFTFGEYFTKEIKNNSTIFKSENIISTGFPFLEEYINKKYLISEKLTNFIKKNDKILVIVSQKTIRNELLNFTIKLSEKLPLGYKILYKIHPIEHDYKKYYHKFIKLKNILLLTNNNYNTLDLIKIANIHITVHSTSVFEALALRKITFLLNHEKYNYEFDKFVDENTIFRVRNVEEFLSKIVTLNTNKNQKKINFDQYYKKKSINNIKKEILKIIKIK